MFRPYVLAIIRLSLNLSSNYTNSGDSGWVEAWERNLVFITMGGVTLDIVANMPLFHHGALF